MTKVRSLSYIFALSLAAALSADGSSGIDLERARAVFDEAQTFEASNPWPARLAGPILLADAQSRTLVGNQADGEGRLRATDGVFVGRLPDDMGVANTAISWSGTRWTLLRWPLPDGHFERRRLIAHELFHRLGPEIGLPMNNPANAHLERFEGRLLMRAELRALTRALASGREARRRSVADALAFRAHRRARFPEAALEEQLLERNEGLAEYTGIRASLPAPARIGWAVQRAEAFDARAGGSSFARSFAYATGPLYGLLLDEVMPGWHGELNDGAGFEVLLARALGPVPKEPAVAARLTRYDGARLEVFERARQAKREAEQQAARARYLEGPVLMLPVDEAFGYTFDPSDVGLLEGAGQILTVATVRGGWGTLEVTGGVLLSRDGANVTGVVVPSPHDPDANPLAGDGWRLHLDQGWQVVAGERPGDWLVRSLVEP